MSKFKKGDWLLESDAEVGKDMLHHGYYVYALLPNGQYVVQTNPSDYELWNESWLEECTVEPRCTGWDWVLPEPSNRFGLKVGDKVTFGTHDGKEFGGGAKGTYVIASIDDGYSDGLARFTLGGLRGNNWHPYWFGLCQSDGSPLPEKPATKKILLEEWCCLQRGTATFDWQEVGNRACVSVNWFKTGVTRELEVPNEK